MAYSLGIKKFHQITAKWWWRNRRRVSRL